MRDKAERLQKQKIVNKPVQVVQVGTLSVQTHGWMMGHLRALTRPAAGNEKGGHALSANYRAVKWPSSLFDAPRANSATFY